MLRHSPVPCLQKSYMYSISTFQEKFGNFKSLLTKRSDIFVLTWTFHISSVCVYVCLTITDTTTQVIICTWFKNANKYYLFPFLPHNYQFCKTANQCKKNSNTHVRRNTILDWVYRKVVSTVLSLRWAYKTWKAFLSINLDKKFKELNLYLLNLPHSPPHTLPGLAWSLATPPPTITLPRNHVKKGL